MNKKMRELQAQILELTTEAKGYMGDGEGRDLDKAETTMNKIDELQKEFDLEARAEGLEKKGVPAEKVQKKLEGGVDGFGMITKMLKRTRLTEEESKALVTGASDESGASYLVPDDVKAEINELRASYVSAKDLVTVVKTDALAGSVNYEDGMPQGLIDFEDGEAIGEEEDIAFVKKPFTIKWRGKLIPISGALLGAEKAGLMSYLNRWFVKNAVISENIAIFNTLFQNANGGPKPIAGWEALKTSITVDLDPSCLIDGVIVTCQSGFAALDAEVDGNGRPILQENPANRTQKMFQGLPIHVFPDWMFEVQPDAFEFPMLYGSLKAGATFVEHEALEFATSEHYLFNKRQNCLRVVEGFDVMSTDNYAYCFGIFKPTV